MAITGSVVSQSFASAKGRPSGSVAAQTSAANIAAVDSLKTLRDQIAHGKNNGTGYGTVKGYYQRAKAFVVDFNSVILGP